MAVIAVAPLVLKDSFFSVVADNYVAAVSSVTFNPTSSNISWKGLTPTSTFTGVTTATWEITIEYAQDWSSTTSLSRYLFENEGKTVAVKFAPQTGTTAVPVFSANVVITPGAIGGAVDSVATASVTLALIGRPTMASAIPA